MVHYSGSEVLLYGGLCIMAGAALAALFSAVIFIRARKKLPEAAVSYTWAGICGWKNPSCSRRISVH